MPKYQKGSQEMKDFMSKVRSCKKSGKGFMGDVLKNVGKTALSYAPLPNVVKNVGEHVIDYGVSKSGLGLRKRTKKGNALLLP
jgi:hypothetical protein